MEAKTVVLFIFLAFALVEGLTGKLFKKTTEKASDKYVEGISIFLLFIFTQPFIILAVDALMNSTFPEYKNSLSDIHWATGFLLFLLFDDMVQYWWHRAAHTFPLMYNLHRAHHDADYMSVRIVYRNNFFFYLLMPAIWFSAILVYLGLGWIYAVFLVIKQTVIIGAHSEWQWDKKLYHIKWLHPVMWVVERTIATPATHSAHHGRHKSDGVTNYKGNFGNLLFFWDVIFGTAKITRKSPKQFGVEGLQPVNWQQQIFWPITRQAQSRKVSEEHKPSHNRR